MSKGSRIRKNKYRGINTSIIAETIKEIKHKGNCGNPSNMACCDFEDDIRKAVVEWLKEDIKIAQKQEIGTDSKMIVQVMKWAKRFGISPDELK